MVDVRIYETGNGGDAMMSGSDFELCYGLENMPYLAAFGGTPGHQTPIQRPDVEQAFDWWGNALLFDGDGAVQINSAFEYAMDTTALNSSGRKALESALLSDLKHMEVFANVSATVSIISDTVIQIDISLLEPDNAQAKQYRYIWDGTRLTSSTDTTYIAPLEGLQYNLQTEIQ